MKLRSVLIGAVATVVAVGLAAPANAAPTDSTITTFIVGSGGLDITAPENASLGTGLAGTTIVGSLGTVSVTDARGASNASWVAQVTSTVFQTGGGSPPETVLPEDIDYWSGPTTATTGNGTFVPGQLNSAAAQPLSSTVTLVAMSHQGGTGANSASWNPTLEVNVPADKVAGTYTGTVTHSVA
jgi:hypothetical protein